MPGASLPNEPVSGLAVALGSGGARGFCHIGVLRALDESALDPAAVVGCSMGALVGAAWAGGRLDAFEEWACGLTQQSVVQSVDPLLFGGGLIAGREVGALLERIGLPDRIEDLDKRFAAVATDLGTGQEVWFRDGSLLDAVRSSVAIPGIFTPHGVDGRWLLDGGLVNPVPVDECRRMGAETVLAVNPNGPLQAPLWSPTPAQTPLSEALLERLSLKSSLPEPLVDLFGLTESDAPESSPTPDQMPNYFDVISVAIDIMTRRVLVQNLQDHPADLCLDLNLRELGVLELFRAQDAIEAGYDEMSARVAELREIVDAA